MRAQDQQPPRPETLAETEARITYQDWVRITGKDPLHAAARARRADFQIIRGKGLFALACIAAAGAALWLGFMLAAG